MPWDMLKQTPATALTANDATSQEELGRLRVESNGSVYRYVQNAGSNTAVKGDVMKFLTSGNQYQVTRSSTAARRNAFAGVLGNALGRNRYGWVQVSGLNTYAYTETNVAAGDALVVTSAAARSFRKLSNTTNLLAIGGTIRADSGSILTSSYLRGL